MKNTLNIITENSSFFIGGKSDCQISQPELVDGQTKSLCGWEFCCTLDINYFFITYWKMLDKFIS